ncbi:MAG: penicillin acylase family protein [Chloroflexi bacterium]|nr:penicillin acylase family protein [Chloroflexota bacterium]MBM3174353.1 penicillin acylase family protein [Chloroflexota bacterium]MBM4450968.1 penicillin acylase family protein [Chloroflexota bacterium]
MKSRWLKASIITVSVIVALVLVLLTATLACVRPPSPSGEPQPPSGEDTSAELPMPSYSGTIVLDGLTAKINVRTDKYGVPHIFAKNEADLFFAQGYITARERLFQMDMTRLAGRGELSTYLGEATIKADKFFKTVGFYRVAEAEYQLMKPESRAIVDAYTKGVNAYIDTCDELPIEYKFLGVEPQPWKPQDSVVAGLLMAYSLNRPKDTELILYQIGLKAGEEVLKNIIPTLPNYAPTVVSESSGNLKLAAPGITLVTQGEPSQCISDWFCPISLNIPASNWMIFAGSRTTTGKAVLTGSPDLQPKIPALFYLIHLKGGRYDVIGGSIPGAPGINVLGFNRKIAWSTTNGRGDELDYFIEKLNPDNPNQYLTENGYKDFQIIDEMVKIKTKDGFSEEKFQVKISRHGPIISDVVANAPANCAMMWVGLQPPTNIFEAFDALIRANNFEEFRRALSVVRTPTLNLGYADVKGNIGYQYVMSVPLRKNGDGTLPVPGDTGEYEWTGFVPFEKLPYDYNPAKGYVASFNNLPKNVDYHITRYFMFERALRFEEIAKSKDKFTPEEIRNMQLDNVSMVAKRWVPEILKACSNMEEVKAALALFQGWNYSMDIHSPAATLFNSFYAHFISNTLEDELGKELCNMLLDPYLIYQPDMMLANIMGNNNHFLFDDVRTPSVREAKEDMVRKSMKDAVDELSARLDGDPTKWEWGKVHTMTFKHPFGSRMAFFNLEPIPTNGDDFTINAGAWDNKNPYAMDSGGVIRMVIDMSNLKSATLISPPGQSGRYKSPYYSDQAEIWAKGIQIPAHYLSAEKLPQLLVLEPGK